jgi:hypothetical protein
MYTFFIQRHIYTHRREGGWEERERDERESRNTFSFCFSRKNQRSDLSEDDKNGRLC